MEWIEIALGNHQGREVLLNGGVENEEDDNVTILAGHSPRGGRERVQQKLWKTNWNMGGIEDINEKNLHSEALFSST